MEVIKYNSSHFNEIKEWHKYYNQDLDESYLSTTGFIILGHACGFLYLTNSKQAYVEVLCKNPHIDKDKTDIALNMIIQEIINYSKELGFKLLIGDTVFKNVVNRVCDTFDGIISKNQFIRLYIDLEK